MPSLLGRGAPLTSDRRTSRRAAGTLAYREGEAAQRPSRCTVSAVAIHPQAGPTLSQIPDQGRTCHLTRLGRSPDEEAFRRPTQPCRRTRATVQPIRAASSWDLPPIQGDAFSSIPSSTPVFPLRRGSWMLTDCPGVDMVKLRARSKSSKAVYVILFGVGQNDTEGIYSLRAFNDEGLPQETIIVFESEEDCTRYAGLLEATMDHTPAVCSIPPAELMDFCMDAGYQCRLEPCGSLLIPPDHNVCVTDWERSMRLREGQWAVLETEPQAHPQGAGSQQLTCSAVQAPPQATGHPLATAASRRPTPAHASTLAKYHPSFSEEELAGIRLMLETLLPRDDEDGPHGDSSKGMDDSWEDEQDLGRMT